ncbi:protein kinase [Chloroflexia bacterium SDU3-3]|nr:protein kinase [Chloroflexia bacterium SDU3-3]
MIICLDQRTGGGCGAKNSDTDTTCHTCGRPLRYALMLMDPDTVVGAYRVLELIGYGGGGAVYTALDMRDAKLVALKETFDPSGTQSFRDEFRALRRQQHPGLPRYYELFEFNGNGYMTMEYIPGQSLHELAEARKGPLPEEEVLAYARQLCAVLIYLHNQDPPLLHRDIKPANVRVMESGQIKLVDFGLLKLGHQRTRKTIQGMGTPAYAPIEQYSPTGQHTDQRSEVYSLGATLYRLLTGIVPPPATERVAVTPDPLVPIRLASPAVSPGVAAVVEQAMAIAQRDRFASVALFAKVLLGMGRPADSPLPPPAPPEISMALAERQSIAAHAEGILALAIHRERGLLASGSADDTAAVWRLADGSGVAQLRGHSRGVNGLAFTADGDYLATGSVDTTVKIWHLPESRDVLTLEKHADWVLALAASPDGETLASGSADGMLWLWRFYDGRPIGSVQSGSGVWSLAWSLDGDQFATGHEDGKVQVRRRHDGLLLRKFEAHSNIVTGVAWQPHGSLLATVGNDNIGMLWNPRTGQPLRSLDGHGGNVACVAFSPDGALLATGCIDGAIRLFRTSDAALVAEHPAHPRGVNALIWAEHGLISAGMDGALRVWDVAKV